MSPIKKAAKKSLRQNLTRKIRNLKKKRAINRLKKEVRVLVSQGKQEQAKKLLPQVYKALDKAAKTGAIKQNKANRLKSKITKLVNKAPQPKPSY